MAETHFLATIDNFGSLKELGDCMEELREIHQNNPWLGLDNVLQRMGVALTGLVLVQTNKGLEPILEPDQRPHEWLEDGET